MGGATLSKSNFLFMGRAVFPPCHLKTMVEIWKIMVTIRRPCAGTAALSALDPAAAHCQPTAVPETPVHSQASLGQSLVGPLLLSPGSSSTQSFVCALQESASQSCVSSGSSMVRSVETSSKRAYAIPRSTAPRAPKTTNCGKF